MRLQPTSNKPSTIRARNWRHKNPDKSRATAKRYRSNNTEKVKEWDKRSRAKIIDRYYAWIDEKKDRPCTDCGQKFPRECMEFDHLKGKKLFNIGSAKTYSIEKLEKEIAKCELVCSNCHRIRTRRRTNERRN